MGGAKAENVPWTIQRWQQLVSKEGEAIGVADGEPYWNSYLGQWQVWVNFGSGCKSVVCDWLVGV
ncbi:hypothetical protein GNF10_30130 [Nostoc sp. UCD121]|uniref:hypothetical protein n=1 Tax=unclassified Nostoc TaxID=2593658 RepID=UPI0016262153|nr:MULTISPECIES: hypothetical protein [unclassified Nostoc]MBC1219667.1 hypothetical protein [Nostoc sp. UCD120]MBC1280091.1 hypothetical protein [Nostoc sp. UCD121]MBC1299359.1 hypothetical protein [Nostoc sp. UCD122]